MNQSKPNQKDLFSELLEAEFAKRKVENPRYSFRAFAHALKIESATLHHIMRGRRKAGPKRVSNILRALGFTPDEITKILHDFARADD